MPALQEVLAGPQSITYGAKPKVALPAGDTLLSKFAADIAAVVKDKGIYRRDTIAVLPYLGRLEVVTNHRLRSWVEKHLVCFRVKYDTGGDPFDVLWTMNAEQAEGTLQCDEFWGKLPEIRAVNPARAYAVEDNTPLELLPVGYDAKRATLTLDTTGDYDDSLSLDECTNGLRDLFKHFPYSEKVLFSDNEGRDPDHFQSRSLAVHIAAMLNPMISLPRYSRAMSFFVKSNSPRSGKTLIVKTTLIPFYGKMAAQSFPRKDEDLRKVLDSEVMDGARYIVFDNIKGFVQSATLEGFATASTWRGRVLGLSKMFEVENLTTVFLTGNDCTLSADMADRSLLIDLYVQQANVQERAVPPEAVMDDAWLMAQPNRVMILSWLSGLIRHWDAAGRPKPTGRLRLGYENWCRVVAGIVEFAGFGDCLASPAEEFEVNNERTNIEALVLALIDYWENVEKEETKRLTFDFATVGTVANDNQLFNWLLDGRMDNGVFVQTQTSKSKFGLMLRRYAPLTGGRVFHLHKWDEAKTPITVCMRCEGAGRHRRYILDLD